MREDGSLDALGAARQTRQPRATWAKAPSSTTAFAPSWQSVYCPSRPYIFICWHTPKYCASYPQGKYLGFLFGLYYIKRLSPARNQPVQRWMSLLRENLNCFFTTGPGTLWTLVRYLLRHPEPLRHLTRRAQIACLIQSVRQPARPGPSVFPPRPPTT